MATITRDTKLEVFFRDRWLCHYCRRPTVFDWVLKRGEAVSNRVLDGPAVTYFNPQWRRDISPLLDELATVVDHVVPKKDDGGDDIANLVTCCARCNQRKGTKSAADYLAENPRWEVKGKYGEPEDWEGLTTLFLALCEDPDAKLSKAEEEWRRALLERRRSAGSE